MTKPNVARNFSVGQHIKWQDDDETPREGEITAVLSVQLLAKTDDGVERVVFLNERTLREMEESHE